MDYIYKDTFTAFRDRGIVTLYFSNEEISITRSLKYRNHSPTGFEFGYLGSGPSQLALAICLEALSENDALKYYMEIKKAFIADCKEDILVIHIERLKDYIQFLKARDLDG